MHVFYTPDIQKSNELPEEEAQHCTRVLRLGIGDEITLTDSARSPSPATSLNSAHRAHLNPARVP